MNFEWRPSLENEWVKIRPLLASDFEVLYEIASDPLIWEQHPNPNRYQKEVFKTFFEGAMVSGGVFLVVDAKTGDPIGSSRFYDLNDTERSIAVGYTFLDRDHWGTTYNRALKNLMLNHAFSFLDRVIFHIGALNIRSQKAIEKLGDQKIGSFKMASHGEVENLNFTYQIRKIDWFIL